MKENVKHFIILALAMFLFVGIVSAEDNVCKGKKGQELATCCNSLDEKDKDTCKNSAYKNCTNQKTLDTKRACCESTFSDALDVQACRVHVERYCNTTDSVTMSKIAMQVKATYEPVEVVDPNNENLTYFMLDIKIFNLTPQIAVNLVGEDISTHIRYNEKNQGNITIRVPNTNEIQTFKIEVVSDDICMEKVLRTLTLTLPKYNQYSDMEVCTEVPTYYLCQQFINFNIDGNKFLENVNNYKSKLANKEIKNANSNKDVNSNIINKTFKTVSNHKYITVGIVLVIGCVVTFLILKNNKRRDDE